MTRVPRPLPVCIERIWSPLSEGTGGLLLPHSDRVPAVEVMRGPVLEELAQCPGQEVRLRRRESVL